MPTRKRSLLLALFLFLIPLSAAQSGNQFFQLFSGYVGVPITNGQQFVLRVLAPFIFVFAITRFLAKGAFNNALNNSGLGGEVGKRAPTLVGIAVAGIVMIMFGSVILPVIIIFAILGLLWFGATSLGYAGRSTGATGLAKSAASKVSGSGSSGSGSDGVSPEEVDEMVGDRINELKGELSSIDDEEQDEKQKEDQTEQEEEEGANPGQVEDEIESEEAELMDIVQKLETVEGQLSEFEQQIESIENQELEEMEDTEQVLHDVDNFQSKFDSWLGETIEKAQRGQIGEEELEEVQEMFGEELRLLDLCISDLQTMHRVHENVEEIVSALQELQQEIEPHAESTIQKAEALVEELEDEEQKAETLAQKYGAREIFEEIEHDESETEEIESEIRNQVVGKMQELESRLQEEINRAKELRKHDQEELNEIINIVQELDVEEKKAGKLSGLFRNPQFEEEIDQVIDKIDRIEEMAQQLSSEHEA